MDPGAHLEALDAAIRIEADGQRLLFAGDREAGAARMLEAAEQYRMSWELAPPRSFGRLVGMLKAAVIAGGGPDEAAYARAQVGPEGDSATSWYVLAIAALVDGDDALAARAADGMLADSPAFARAAAAVSALARRDADAYAAAARAIVGDFEGRDEHLTGVRIADTALMLERLAERRGLAAHPASALLPA